MNSLSGDESVQKKIDLMVELQKRCQSEDEIRFLVRSFANTGLRIGLSTKSVEKCIIEYFKAQQQTDRLDTPESAQSASSA